MSLIYLAEWQKDKILYFCCSWQADEAKLKLAEIEGSKVDNTERLKIAKKEEEQIKKEKEEKKLQEEQELQEQERKKVGITVLSHWVPYYFLNTLMPQEIYIRL